MLTHPVALCWLQELALSYLNEYIIHWPIAGNDGDTVKPSIQVLCGITCCLQPSPTLPQCTAADTQALL